MLAAHGPLPRDRVALQARSGAALCRDAGQTLMIAKIRLKYRMPRDGAEPLRGARV